MTTRLILDFLIPLDEPRFDRQRSASPREDYRGEDFRGDRARSRSPNGRIDERYVIDSVLQLQPIIRSTIITTSTS